MSGFFSVELREGRDALDRVEAVFNRLAEELAASTSNEDRLLLSFSVDGDGGGTASVLVALVLLLALVLVLVLVLALIASPREAFRSATAVEYDDGSRALDEGIEVAAKEAVTLRLEISKPNWRASFNRVCSLVASASSEGKNKTSFRY